MAEEWLDYSWIDVLSNYSTPRAIGPDWTVKIESHFIGGLRHFGSWEVADIGVLLFIRTGGTIRRSKVALLQSKRLYPTTGTVSEQGITDYHYGFARLADPEDLAQSIGTQAEYEFTEQCRYGALIAKSPQVNAIRNYERQVKLRVYYQFYNPWNIPLTQRVPVVEPYDPPGSNALGVRVIPATDVHKVLSGNPEGFRPTLGDISRTGIGPDGLGWALEDFMADGFLGCTEGSSFESIGDDRIQSLFYRRTGPISSAISITIEGPETAGV
jgi:hypothetical protein